MDGDRAPVIGATEHVSHEVRLRGDLLVDVVRREGFQIAACSEDSPRDASGPGTQSPANRCARYEELGFLPRFRGISKRFGDLWGVRVPLSSCLGLTLLGQLPVFRDEDSRGGPPMNRDARRLCEGPSAQFEWNRRPFLVLTDESIENVRRSSQRTSIGRPADATEFRLNDMDPSLSRACAATQGDSVGCEDVNDKLEEFLDGSGGRGAWDPLRFFASHRFVVASLGGDTNVELCAAGKELVLVERPVRGSAGRSVDADAVTSRQRGFSGVAVLVFWEGHSVEGERTLPDRKRLITSESAIIGGSTSVVRVIAP